MKKQRKTKQNVGSEKKAGQLRKVGPTRMADRGRLPFDVLGWVKEAGRWYRPVKEPITVRLDSDVVAWFKADGHGYQTRINDALRKVMIRERKNRPKVAG